MKETHLSRALFLLPSAMCLIALLPLPYGYYQLLRLVVTGASCFLAYGLWATGGRASPVILGLIAAIYNPVFPIYFVRSIWFWINIGSAILFGVAAVVLELCQIADRRRRERAAFARVKPLPPRSNS